MFDIKQSLILQKISRTEIAEMTKRLKTIKEVLTRFKKRGVAISRRLAFEKDYTKNTKD